MTTSPLPGWIPEAAWQGWEEMRRRKKKPLTPRARAMAINTLAALFEEGNNPEMVLAQSEFHCWTGLFAINQGFGQQFMKHKKQEEELREHRKP